MKATFVICVGIPFLLVGCALSQSNAPGKQDNSPSAARLEQVHAATPDFVLHVNRSEIPATRDGAPVKPSTAPEGLHGVVKSRGNAVITLTDEGIGFGPGGQQAKNAAWLQFVGASTGDLFDSRSPGELSFRLTSAYDMAERRALSTPALPRVFENVLNAYAADGLTVFKFSVAVHDNLIAFIYSFAGGSPIYSFLPKGEEDRLFGKGKVLQFRFAWDGLGHHTLFLNGKPFASGIHPRIRPHWNPESSFSIGAGDQHEYSGGFFACADLIADVEFRRLKIVNRTPPEITVLYPADGATVTGTALAAVKASAQGGAVQSVEFRWDDKPLGPAQQAHPFVTALRTAGESAGPHKLMVIAHDEDGNTGSRQITVHVASPSGPDQEAPDPPTGLRIGHVTASAIALEWRQATDNVAVTAYRVYRDNIKIADVPNSASLWVRYGDSGLSAGEHRYELTAIDAAGNESPRTPPYSVWTLRPGARVIEAGPNATFKTVCAALTSAHSGDIIEVDGSAGAGYPGDVCLWRAAGLTVRGVNGRPRIEANGSSAAGKGVLVVDGEDTTIENIEISGAVVGDHNGAAIRQERKNLTVRNCYFHDNQDGILANSVGGTDLIEFSEFAHNGDGSGQSHNLYINDVEKLIFRYNYSHSGNVGHLLKTRARENEIVANRITDEDGTASYEIDLPNGGATSVLGNIIEQSATTSNANFMTYGTEGLPAGRRHDLTIAYNTFVNLSREGYFLVANKDVASMSVENNLFAGPIELTIYRYNGAHLRGNVQSKDLRIFAKPEALDFYLARPADFAKAVPSKTNAPAYEYLHWTSGKQRKNLQVVGAEAR